MYAGFHVDPLSTPASVRGGHNRHPSYSSVTGSSTINTPMGSMTGAHIYSAEPSLGSVGGSAMSMMSPAVSQRSNQIFMLDKKALERNFFHSATPRAEHPDVPLGGWAYDRVTGRDADWWASKYTAIANKEDGLTGHRLNEGYLQCEALYDSTEDFLVGQIQQKHVDIGNLEKELADKRAMRVKRDGASAKLRAKLKYIQYLRKGCKGGFDHDFHRPTILPHYLSLESVRATIQAEGPLGFARVLSLTSHDVREVLPDASYDIILEEANSMELHQHQGMSCCCALFSFPSFVMLKS